MASSSSKHGATALTGHAAFARGRYSEAARAFTALMDSSGGGSAILYFNRAVAYMGMNRVRSLFVCLVPSVVPWYLLTSFGPGW